MTDPDAMAAMVADRAAPTAIAPDGFPPAYLTGDALRNDPPPLPEGVALVIPESGRTLLRAEMVSLLFGQPSVGKSFLALGACIEVAASGGLAAFIDFEEDARAFHRRLHVLHAGPTRRGVESDATLTDRVGYLSPDGPFDPDTMMPPLGTRLVVMNGLAHAMATFDLNENDTGDFLRWKGRVIAPIHKALPDAHVQVIDHPGHGDLGRPRGASGKTDAVDLSLELKAAGQWAHLVNRKDRHGVTGTRRGAKVAEMRLHFDPDDTVTVELRAVEDERGPAGEWLPTRYMERVSMAMERAPDWLSGNKVEELVGQNREHVRTARDALVRYGFMSSKPGPRNSTLYRSMKPYREGDDFAQDGRAKSRLGQA